LVERINGVAGANPLAALSPRERDVLARIADGCTSSQIARELHISVHTVDTHRRKLMEKLNLHSLAAVIRFAIQHGLAALPQEETVPRR
jgi:DNA-binding CsgD family transcriptional regulator